MSSYTIAAMMLFGLGLASLVIGVIDTVHAFRVPKNTPSVQSGEHPGNHPARREIPRATTRVVTREAPEWERN